MLVFFDWILNHYLVVKNNKNMEMSFLIIEGLIIII
jgi:hypothetical protein